MYLIEANCEFSNLTIVLVTLSLNDRIMPKKSRQKLRLGLILEAFAIIFPSPRKSQLIPSSRKPNFLLIHFSTFQWVLSQKIIKTRWYSRDGYRRWWCRRILLLHHHLLFFFSIKKLQQLFSRFFSKFFFRKFFFMKIFIYEFFLAKIFLFTKIFLLYLMFAK